MARDWLEGVSVVGATSVACAPEVLVEAIVARLWASGAAEIRTAATVHEDVHFTLAPELMTLRADRSSALPVVC